MTFSVKEVCEIIDACAKGGVSVFKLGGLYLKRGALDAPNAPAPETTRPLTAEEQFAAEREAEIRFKEKETEIRNEQLSRMRLEDPEMYEELVVAKELDNATGQEPEGLGT